MGHRLIAVVPLLLAGWLAGCDGSAPTDTFELSGFVTELIVDGTDAPGIEGATVSFTSDTLLVSQATTDSSGRYRMRVATDHPFGQVRATAPDFFPQETTVLFDTPERRIDLRLRRMVGGDG